jgi:hypothetical protein
VLTKRGRLAVFLVAIALIAISLALLAGVNGGEADDDEGQPGPIVSVPTASAPSVPPERGPSPPHVGAWVGAWVKPDLPTQNGQLASVAAFESQLGRPLDIVQVYHQWTDEFPSTADEQFAAEGRTLLISWNGEDTRVILSGRYDDLISQRAQQVKALGKPILLRWRWEMNRPNLQGSVWSGADFVAAWKHIRAIFTRVGATNAAWVWCPTATSFDSTQGPSYYPGDDQVDWLCTDVYPGPDYRSFSDVASEFMAWAAGHDKPILIAEYGAEDGEPGQRIAWMNATTTFVKTHPQIKGVVYYDARHQDNGRDRDFSLVPGTAPWKAFVGMAKLPYFDTGPAPPVPSASAMSSGTATGSLPSSASTTSAGTSLDVPSASGGSG